MLTDHRKQRISYVFLCATPFVAFIAAAVRPLRIPGVYHVIGVVLFAAISIAAWTLGARTIRADVQSRRLLGLAGILLVTPFALVALLWVGIGGPWARNRGREPDALVLFSLLWPARRRVDSWCSKRH